MDIIRSTASNRYPVWRLSVASLWLSLAACASDPAPPPAPSPPPPLRLCTAEELAAPKPSAPPNGKEAVNSPGASLPSNANSKEIAAAEDRRKLKRAAELGCRAW